MEITKNKIRDLVLRLFRLSFFIIVENQRQTKGLAVGVKLDK